ncbi:class I SAM-dependent methyltransferase [Micromonospora rifamycinica]|uniref:class I SAM-dependent methyltransferase n=1 Tax=Micromonospora rifamycinica TaxID=291594 RepID=UPI0034033AFC
MPHDSLIELLDLDAEVLHDYVRDVVGWVGREAAGRPHVADLGAGSGTASLALARQLPGATVTAFDQSPEMLAHLRERAEAAGLADRIRTVEADLDRPWPDLGPVEVIFAAASMHHLADPAGAVASAFRALRPGGLLVIAELDSFPRFLTGTPDEELESRGHAGAAKRRHEAGMHMHEPWGDRMAQAGFTAVTERHFDIDLRPPLSATVTRYAQVCLGRMRHGLQGWLSPDDLAALDEVVEGLPGRSDLSVRTERTVWLGRR